MSQAIRNGLSGSQALYRHSSTAIFSTITSRGSEKPFHGADNMKIIPCQIACIYVCLYFSFGAICLLSLQLEEQRDLQVTCLSIKIPEQRRKKIKTSSNKSNCHIYIYICVCVCVCVCVCAEMKINASFLSLFIRQLDC